MGRPLRQIPADLVKDWPQRPSHDPDVETARVLAINLLTAMDGRSLRATKALCGVDHTTIAAILQGRVWPDLQTIARLESGLRAELWPQGVAARLGRHGSGKAES